MTDRHCGALIPLFSIRSSSSWGIGELADLAPCATWLASAGFDRLMLLPIGTMTGGPPSPYSSSSTMGIDPIYIAVDALQDFVRAGGHEALSEEARQSLARARQSPAVDYAAVQRAKQEALAIAFERFFADEWALLTPRAAEFGAYLARERWWLDDYALFHALSRAMAGVRWRDWPAGVRDREPRAIDEARRHLAKSVLQEQYWQWIAEGQWQQARRHATASGVSICGDLPFVGGGDSADVWVRPDDYLTGVSAGVPPDAFSADGQDWGLPTYHWAAIAAQGYQWLTLRARRMAALFDVLRIDHLVGFYRTYGRPPVGAPFFNPEGEDAQRHQGETVLRIFLGTGLALVAEDLGTVPDFVRASLTALGVPGCKVLRWERAWHVAGQPFVDPATFPLSSAAMTGTHDTDPVSLWWEHAPLDERAAVLALPSMQDSGITDPGMPWHDGLRDALLRLAYRAGSRDLFLPIQDVFGWCDRINVPGTVGAMNWTWALPWPVDKAADIDEVRARAAFTRALAATRRSQ